MDFLDDLLDAADRMTLTGVSDGSRFALRSSEPFAGLADVLAMLLASWIWLPVPGDRVAGAAGAFILAGLRFERLDGARCGEGLCQRKAKPEQARTPHRPSRPPE